MYIVYIDSINHLFLVYVFNRCTLMTTIVGKVIYGKGVMENYGHYSNSISELIVTSTKTSFIHNG